MAEQKSSRSSIDLAFERKVRLSTWALLFEQLWPRLWVVLGIAALFVLISLAGIWSWLGNAAHKGVLAIFAVAFLAAFAFAARVRWPSREEAIRRIERTSGAPHRPASSYEDALSGAAAAEPATMALWQAHRDRLARALARLRVGHPSPRTDRYDPFALRALGLVGTLLVIVLVGDSIRDRLGAAFRFGVDPAAAAARLDAWVTPPPYTGRAPVMLADGARPELAVGGADGKPLQVPDRSVLIVRSTGLAAGDLVLEIETGGSSRKAISADAPRTASDVAELRHEIRKAGKIRVLRGGTEVANWAIAVTPDQPPRITLTKEPERTARGSMKLTYKVEDDYGVASAAVKLAKTKAEDGDPATAWARTEVLKGPRLPLERPPPLPLRLPGAGGKGSEAQTYLELGSHPWAGLKVTMTLEATDVAGQVGRSGTMEIILPSRNFENPLARAVVEQRRKLVEDARYRGQVLKALDALTLEPDDFIEDTPVYLGLRSVYHRLQQDRSRAGLKSAIEHLWHIALKIEDGDLSEAERALRDAQEKLSKALEQGASDEEIQNLMQELRQALNEYVEQLSRQAENQPSDIPPGLNQQSQLLNQQDLERMMRNIEELAKNGARDQAQQLLSELRDIMERMQTGRMAEQQMQQSQQMMKMMDELSGIVGDQQKLLDDTFNELRRQDGRDQKGAQQQGRQGERKGQQQGQRGQGRGDRKSGQQRQRGEGGESGEQSQGEQGGQGQLGQRQGQLREQLDELRRQLREGGMGDPQQLEAAREAMENAERALQQGELGDAADEQAQALDQMRQGAQSMAQEMMRNMPQRYGQSGDTPRDPLGRPQRSQGPDLGTSVKVPDQIDIQRAREILEELRRRLGEPQRPQGELDYIERLLRRF